jgi:hypothetical protein
MQRTSETQPETLGSCIVTILGTLDEQRPFSMCRATRHYVMIRCRKALILLTFRRGMRKSQIRGNSRTKKPANVLMSRAFKLVAGNDLQVMSLTTAFN